MAKIDPTSLFTEIRGTVGGLTFSKNRAGFFVQRLKKGIPSTRPTPQTRRTSFGDAARYWSLHRNDIYEDPEKGDIPVSEFWDDYAQEPGNEKTDVFGGSYQASGYNWFLTYAMAQAIEGAAPLILPPTTAAPTLWPQFRVDYFASAAASNSFFQSLYTSTAQGSRPWISCRIQYSAAVKPVVPPFFFIKTFAYTTAAYYTLLQTDLESVFGSIPDNTRAYFSVRFRVPDGKFSTAVDFSLLSGESYVYTP